ncbi:MAG TPA: formyl transferase [Planctomycetes bacterium]|nr:formyl transferase [Planctomycetota bacterium]
MNLLLLGPERPQLARFLKRQGDSVQRTEAPLSPELDVLQGADFLICYGYREIIRSNILKRFPGSIINIHISLLPWNRGSDPNLWSFLEETPKGVSVHLLDAGIDTGPLLCQREVTMVEEDTLRSSYERLSTSAKILFMDNWKAIRVGQIQCLPQPPGGTYHRARDLEPFQHLLTDGWDTPVKDLIGKAKKA